MTELRRRSTGIPSLKRCSTTFFAKNIEYDDSCEVVDQQQQQQQLGFFQFDSLQYASTHWRNKQMMHQQDEHNNINEPQVISHFGSHVNFTSSDHYTADELEPYRMIGDVEMDALLDYLAEQKSCGAFDDVIAFCEEAYHQLKCETELHGTVRGANDDVVLPAKFYQHYQRIPPWVDWEQIQRGIDIFLAYLPAAGCALYYRSLIGGFSIPKIVEVLIATRYLVPASMRQNQMKDVQSTDEVGNEECSNDDRKRTFERLMDTGGFMACCFAPPQQKQSRPPLAAAALRPREIGWKAALRVRVLHAKVRRSLLRSKSWNMKNGIPINQEDMAATLLAFSVNVLLGIEYIAGRPLSEEDQRDYLALWRYLGWLLGVDTPEEGGSSNTTEGQRLPPIDPCGLNKNCDRQASKKDAILHSYATLESMILHLLHPTIESRQLVYHLLSFNGRVQFRSDMCRKFLGDPLSDNLGIANRSTGTTRCTVYFVLVFLRCYTLLAMTFPRIRQTFIQWHGAFYKRFLRAWQRNHDKRVGDAMGREGAVKKSCPFSMLMPPVDS
ncbi:hypothetical protein ACHAXN_005491 [Cyclotella atomus]